MSIDTFEEQYREEILNIVNSDSDYESKFLQLKLYLIKEPYFQQFAQEPSYLTRQILNTYTQYKKD